MAKEQLHVPIDRAVLNKLASRVLGLKSAVPDKRNNRAKYKDLLKHIDPAVVHAIKSTKNVDAQNRQLRSVLSEYLKGNHPDVVKCDIADWIVASWGSITQGRTKIPNWISEFSNFDVPTVDAFRAKVGHKWMSSWTKIISFADHSKYPVYDANNAVALNVLLEPISTSNFFYMPEGRASFVKEARAKLIQKHKKGRGLYPDLGGYSDYEYLISRVVAQGALRDVLEAEQLLFSRSVGVAKTYLSPQELAAIEAQREERKELAKQNRATGKAPAEAQP